ncbi:MAG: hypothetical protein PHT55_08165 [Spirochaetales bacterium]|nr:hypothetical protein [Spirochaetales bacterium]
MNKAEKLYRICPAEARRGKIHTQPRKSALFFLLILLWALSVASGFAQGAQQNQPGAPTLPPEVLLVEAAAARDGSLTRYQGFETRYGLAASPVVSGNISALVGKVETFALEVIKFKDQASGEQRLYGTGEAHGLFDVPMEAALAVVLDYPNLKAISPRVRNVKVLESADNRILVYEDIGINFMGISIGYVLDAEVFSDKLPDGALGMRARLSKSHDGKLYASDSSWYFRRVEVGGKAYTYIRTWSSSGLRNPGLGVAGVMKLFTAGELKDQIEAVAKLAATR